MPDIIEASEAGSLEVLFDQIPSGCPGARPSFATIAPLTAVERVRAIVASWLGPQTRPVRLLLLDKSATANWALGWHQDRTVAVRTRREVAGFGAWTQKAGVPHVAPPIDVLQRMITARLHLDDIDEDNAPLLIAPGSHRMGLIRESAIDAAVATCGTAPCLADRGDVWLYSTPILHASARAAPGRRRRVIQIDFAAFDLPGGLEWTT
ncbi:phytanoyl-CoA dioxygenase family protein [Sphingomonas qomolangmaensis]|uniref:Phytanoyl-CoA dioxygenase family protein n=1 Tax=Sphingomonas qomolangmaensis TaxID=2918765 RepID=A0ABY5LCU3_9SPHN|nr:phytanoyl-CoA dioxygenase family protein [Sphingomonas qomolangmaensis]UUL83534.1 phytanoyl-CoA dioxygenase family protein [Sphingomonas qomolangmaensis]